MGDESLDNAPRHPSLARRSLVAWPGYHSGLATDQLDRSIVGAIAKPLPHAVQDPRPVTEALRLGMGVALPAQAWRNQLPLDHAKRTGMFSVLPHHRPDRQLDPDDKRFSATFAETYAADHLAAELGAGATILTTPGHVLTREGSTGRENDLLLARLATQEFAARGAAAPPPGRPATMRRELYATIILQGVHAREPAIVGWLINAYAALDGISGYWIIAANCSGSGAQVAGYAWLALGLQRATQRSAVVSCVGDAHLALLASGVAATCAGVHGMSFAYPPAELPEHDEDEDRGLGIFVYHQAVLGNVGAFSEEGERARLALFGRAPCPCGHHPANSPPRGKRQIVAHNSWAVSRDALAFAVPEVSAAEKHLDQRVQQAARRRALLGLTGVKPGFRSVPRVAAELRAADAPDQPGEQPG